MTQPTIYCGTYKCVQDGSILEGPLVKYEQPLNDHPVYNICAMCDDPIKAGNHRHMCADARERKFAELERNWKEDADTLVKVGEQLNDTESQLTAEREKIDALEQRIRDMQARLDHFGGSD